MAYLLAASAAFGMAIRTTPAAAQLARWSPVAAAPAAPVPPPAAGTAAPARGRLAIREFVVEGDETSPALGMQLQDGFVIGLAQTGFQVLDSVDVARRLQGHPELQRCDTAICLKSMGQLLEVRHVVGVRVNVTGNSYRMTARLFSADGSSPVALPVATQSRFCEVCTVAEAREVMIRLADAIRRPLEDASALPASAPANAAGEGTSRMPLLGMTAGLLAMVAGAGVLFAADDHGKSLPAVGGALLGAGLTVTSVSIYLIARQRGSGERGATGVGVAFRF